MTRRLTVLSLLGWLAVASIGPVPWVLALPDLARLDPALRPSVSGPRVDPDLPISAWIELHGPTAFDLWQARRGAADLLAPPVDEATRVSSAASDAVNHTPAALKRSAALDAIFSAVTEGQAAARAYVVSSGATLIDTYDTAMNGFLVHATPAQLMRLTLTPGVNRIYRAPWLYPLLDDAVPMIGAQAAQETLGISGKEVHVAVIDTGIDYTHRNLGGSGRQDEYYSVDPDRIVGRTYPNRRVVGGYDFAGTYYGSTTDTPTPDDNPLDEVFHGTHVAGIIGGGRGNPKVHNGVAPDVALVALKVFGRNGGTDLYMSAVEWAIEANLGRPVKGRASAVDVMNLSLGANWADGVGPDVEAMRRATDAGIVVVASAGNAGNAPFVAGAPAAAPDAISVASTYASGEMADAIIAIVDNDNQNPVKLEAEEADPGLAKTIREVKNLRAPLAYYGTGCNGAAKPDITGKVALIALGPCPEREFAENAKKSGAVGIVAYGGQVFILGLGNGGRADVDIPAVMIEQADGERLKSALDGGRPVDIVYGTKYLQSLEKTYLADVISPFSSRGPARIGGLKPNLSAPGSDIFAPLIASGDDGVFLSGTSMAGPMVAGAAALVVQRLLKAGRWHHGQPGPLGDGLSALDVGALLMNTAAPTVWRSDQRTGVAVPLARGGAGRVDALAAVKAQTIVRGGAIADLDFGVVAVTGTYRASAPVTVRNLSSGERRYQLAVRFRSPDDENSGVTIWPEPAQLDVPAGGVVTATVRLAADAAALKAYRALGGQYAMADGDDRLADAEHDADLWVSESELSDEKVRLPIYVLPRGVSGVSASLAPANGSPNGTLALNLHNSGAKPGRAELFTQLAADGVETGLDPRLDIDRVGARIGGAGPGRYLDVVVHTRGARRIPFDAQLNVILDTNGDGAADWISYYDDLEDLLSSGQRPSGRQTIFLRRVTHEQPLVYDGRIAIEDGIFADVNLNSRTIILRLVGVAIGLPADGTGKVGLKFWLRANFDDVAGGSGRPPWDDAPDGAVTVDSQGRPQLAGGWLQYDEARQSFKLSGAVSADVPVSVQPGQAWPSFRLSPQAPADPLFTTLLLSYPQNAPDGSDAQSIEMGAASAPTPSATVTLAPASRTPTADATPGATTATPTPSGGPTYRVWVPVAAKAWE